MWCAACSIIKDDDDDDDTVWQVGGSSTACHEAPGFHGHSPVANRKVMATCWAPHVACHGPWDLDALLAAQMHRSGLWAMQLFFCEKNVTTVQLQKRTKTSWNRTKKAITRWKRYDVCAMLRVVRPQHGADPWAARADLDSPTVERCGKIQRSQLRPHLYKKTLWILWMIFR